MLIVVKDGISEEAREDTFWESMVNNIHNVSSIYILIISALMSLKINCGFVSVW